MPGPERRPSLAAAAAVALLSLLPFARGLISGGCFYFRDLSLHFFPLRRLVLEGLRHGELRFWNPLVQEGVPLPLPALSYPFDLLQLVVPDERGLSLFLIAHVTLAGLALVALARSLQLDATAAVAGGVVYALGGFLLSTVNLYYYLLAAAWAPLLVLALLRATRGDGRALAWATVASAIALTTGGVEVVVQAVVVAFVLAAPPLDLGARIRPALAVGLGAGLAAYALLPAAGLVPGTARALGFAPEVVTAHSVHPITLLQVLVAGLYGEPHRLTEHWWGQNFFPRGFPYFVSLYLGPSVLALAALGAGQGRTLRRRLALLAVAAAVLSLGTFVGLDALVAALPFPRIFRYPSKAFFTVHLAVSLLAAQGLDALLREEKRSARRLAALALVPGALLAAAPLLPRLAPATFRWLVAGFFPAELSWPMRLDRAGLVLADAAAGGALALVTGLLAVAVARRWLSLRLAGPALVVVLAADLARVGAGLNPMVTPAFYASPPLVLDLLPELRGGRVFTCNPHESVEYQRARAARAESHEVWTFAALAETLTPAFNVPWGVASAYSEDLTMAVPLSRVLPLEDAACSSFSAIRERLRAAGVTHVLSLQALDDDELAPLPPVAPARIAPLVVHVSALQGAWPRRVVASTVRTQAGDRGEDVVELDPLAAAQAGVAAVTAARGRVLETREDNDRLEIEAEADKATVVLVRDGWSAGWQAEVDGKAAPVLLADGRHRAVPIGPGRHRVVLHYEAPYWRRGVTISLVSLALLAGLVVAAPAGDLPLTGPREAGIMLRTRRP